MAEPVPLIDRPSPTTGGPPHDNELVRGRLPRPELGHLGRLTHPRFGVWEHARFFAPRWEHGFCTDDNARALIVACQQATDPAAGEIAEVSLRFVIDAHDRDGRVRNRRTGDGRWLEDRRSDDAEGRTIWGLGIAARRAPRPEQRRLAIAAFEGRSDIDSDHPRPYATSILGCAEMLAAVPGHAVASRRVASGAEVLDRAMSQHTPRLAGARQPTRDAVQNRRGGARRVRHDSPWPQPRLTYDDARLPEAMMVAGELLHETSLVQRGLELLHWLASEQTHDGRFSFTPAGGRAPGGDKPAFDQQPLEASAMADACARAWLITGDPVWLALVRRAAWWLLGFNDIGLALYDVRTGATCDGLTEDSVNLNRGAESTIAGLATLQIAQACEQVAHDRRER